MRRGQPSPMRSVVLMLLLLFAPLMGAMVLGEEVTMARSGPEVGIASPSEVIVHQNETASTYITLHNKASVNQAFTIEAGSLPEHLSVVGLPSTTLLVPNHLQQVAFGIRASNDAPFQNETVSFWITSDVNASLNETVTMNVWTAKRSNLSFGGDGSSEFFVDEKVRTSIAVNISNNATYPDNVSFSITGSAPWTWGWNMANTVGLDAYIQMQPNTLAYVYLWVDIPAVENGLPLQNTGPEFYLTATSALDRTTETWRFDLLMNQKRNASIDIVESEVTVAPNQDARASLTVRNVGNSPNRLNMTLFGLASNGQTLDNVLPSDRFNASGWTVALFGALEDEILQPNESRVVEIGFQAPDSYSGSMEVEFRVFPTGAATYLRTATVRATIVRESSAELTYLPYGCNDIAPEDSCMANLTVENTGNARTTFTLRAGEVTDGFEVSVPSATRVLEPGFTAAFDPVRIYADPGVLAFTQGTAVVEVLDDEGSVLDTVEVSLKVAPVIEWTFRNIEEQVNAKGRLTLAMEVRNDGNAVDGLIVQLQSTHSVPMGFIPPEGAIFEGEGPNPRSFELNDIPLNSNFTIRAWVDLPMDQNSNGTVYINTSIRSRLAPEIPFVHTTQADYLGIPWQPAPEVDEGIDWGGLASTGWLYLKAWSGVLVAIVISGLIIFKAVKDREHRMLQATTLPYQEVSTAGAEDWMKHFQPQPDVVKQPSVLQQAPVVDASAYEQHFRQQHGEASMAQPSVDPKLVNAATLVLDQRTEEAHRHKADMLLDSILPAVKDAGFPNTTSTEEIPPTTQEHPSIITERGDGAEGTQQQAASPAPFDDDLEF